MWNERIRASVQAALFFFSWLMGMQIIGEKKHNQHVILAIIAFVLFVPLGLVVFNSSFAKKYEWPNDGLSLLLPAPPVERGEILYNNDNSFYIEVYRVSPEEYSKYAMQCQEKGFTMESEKRLASYKAFDANGNKLEISYMESQKMMDIHLDAPKTMSKLRWPNSTIVGLLPKTESDLGFIATDETKSFAAYIGDTSPEAYAAYVDACMEAGFIIDYSRGDTYFYADNKEGYDLTLRFQGNKTMYIHLSGYSVKEPPNEATPDNAAVSPEATAVPSATPTSSMEQTNPPELSSTPVPDKNAAQGLAGIRPEIKDAIDAYEAFFRDYCAFMKKFSASNNTASMLADYLDYMTAYSETMNKLDALDNADLSKEESAYYTDTMVRINKMLLEFAS